MAEDIRQPSPPEPFAPGAPAAGRAASGRFDFAPGQWEALRQLLDQALALPAAARSGWLASLDAQHAALKPRLQSLLAHADRAALPVDALPQVETTQFAPRPGGDERDGLAAGDRIGRYRLVRPLGAGGMGSVWLAERDDMLQRRQVALKLPRLVTGRAALAERLAREREILAALDHPHIARLYDAGLAADGRPYLALEYVEGERLDAWCVRNALDVPARLQLFLQVARAVAHAHANLVVHRDLKPANILVTAAGVVKLLDFGIAKLLDDGRAQETELTQLAGRALTPDYAAPEQILGQPVGTAADVYALGVVLFELLAGSRPYRLRRGSRAELEEAIVQADVPRPSALAVRPRLKRRLRGDLDTIVLKALKKLPAERYGTVEALADDIERHLARRPVRARPDRSWYRLRRFVARNRAGVGAATLAFIALAASGATALWQAREASRERDAAQQAALRAQQQAQAAELSARVARAHTTVSQFLIADLTGGRPMAEVAAQVGRAVALIRSRYADDPQLRGRLLADYGARLLQLGQFEQHRTLLDEARSAAESAGDKLTVLRVDCDQARHLSQRGQVPEARARVARAVATLRALPARPDGYLESCLSDASAIARLAGDSAGAIVAIEETLALHRAAGVDRSETYADALLSATRAYAQAGRYRDALRTAEDSIALRQRLGFAASTGMVGIQSILAGVLRDGGQPLRSLAITGALLATARGPGGVSGPLAAVEYEHAATLLRLGRATEARAAAVRAQAQARASGDAAQLRGATVLLALARLRLGQPEAAAADLRAAGALYAEIRRKGLYIARLPLFAEAEAALRAGDLEQARALLDEVERILDRQAAGDPARRVLWSYRAQAALRAGDAGRALQLAERALAMSTAQAIDPAASLHVAEDMALRAEARWAAGQIAAAAADAAAAARQLEAVAGPGHPLQPPMAALARRAAGRNLPV